MLSLPALFGFLVAPGLVLMMTSVVVAMFEQDDSDKPSIFTSNFSDDANIVK
ncbi:hypothetical protein HII17_02260 [Thalassotalea sp. M1531]|uniref:Uncharacterized protein n=1 Tax=Thalassotalea algicola TaxID=2716224 RepID=A0A7Y0L9E3_9GAMM|nr:hypothetical protein [Thalassotalea algicola]NMP30373.1 hypothetical protein [Thalassotalea algicola]